MWKMGARKSFYENNGNPNILFDEPNWLFIVSIYKVDTGIKVKYKYKNI